MNDLGNEMGKLRRLVNAAIEKREQIQHQGINVLPVNFYSSTPSIVEIRDSFEYEGADPLPSPRPFLTMAGWIWCPTNCSCFRAS